MPAKTVYPTTRQRPPAPAQAAQATQQALPWPAERKGQRQREGTAHAPTPRPRAPISFAPGAGIAASKVRGGVKCGGCDARHPPIDCCACGAPTVITLADPDFPHVMTFCRAHARVLLAARAESKRELAEATREGIAAAAQARAHAEAPSSTAPTRRAPARKGSAA